MKSWKLTPYQRRRCREQLKQCRDAREYRRLLAVLHADEGQSVTEVARRLGMSRQSVHSWLGAFHETKTPDILQEKPRSGRPSIWNDAMREQLCQWLAQSPEAYGWFSATWTVPLLQEQLRQCYDEAPSEDAIRRELHRLGYTWKRSRYVLEPDPEREKKTANSPPFAGVGVAQRDSGRG